jgi:hypothetical protein
MARLEFLVDFHHSILCGKNDLLGGALFLGSLHSLDG